jgi:hypothetical protein
MPGPANNSVVSVVAPAPIRQVGAVQPMLPVSPPNLANANYEQLQQMLTVRHVNSQHLETWGTQGDWSFTCTIPNPEKPGFQRRYVAKAAGPNGLEAIRKVIAEIDLHPPPTSPVAASSAPSATTGKK